MPELPEVEVTARGLKTKVLGRTFVDVWTDFQKIVKKPGFKKFKEELKGREIKRVRRRGKNIIIDLSENLSLLIHQKMTGHLLYGKWERKKGGWEPRGSKIMEDRNNGYIHLMFYLDNKKMLALSDLRKFAKVELWETGKLEESEVFTDLGPDPLKISFREFKEAIKERKGKIKKVLMDQKVLAGAGNIYSDEALFRAKIHPFKRVSDLTGENFKNLYQALIEVLKKGIEAGGESISDYRNLKGERGGFDEFRKIYRKDKCPSCGGPVKREKLGNRSTYFCPKRQKL